ncbi:MAG: tetratricopeptide repeat protein [Anaerolineaceae bacterium]|nr:tetratricopeptide repeat protein [Anaerolineaceae bacterium]
MFHEALQAAQAGDRSRARDLLTRLLKVRQDNVDYWVWMSAVVETPKERKFCLKEALRLDPENSIARRGLVLLGALPPDESQVDPLEYQKRSWQPSLPGGRSNSTGKKVSLSVYQVVLMGIALLALVGLVVFAFWGAEQQMKSRRRLVINLPTITPTFGAEVTQIATRTQVNTGSPVPLWMLLDATFTPTPVYVNTPHPESEAFRIGLRALQREEWKNADNYFRQAATEVAKSSPGSVDILYYVAENARLEGNLTDALKIYAQVIVLSPNFAPAYLGRARALIESDPEKSAEKAIADLKTAVKKDPFYAEAFLELAVIQLQAGQPKPALDTLDASSEVLKDSPLAYLYRAQAQLMLKDYPEALANARRANHLDITLLLPYRIMGEVLQAIGDEQGSLDPLNTYLNYEKNDPQAWLLLANANLASGQSAEAQKALDLALRLNNRLTQAYVLRGHIELDTNKAEKALADYQAALRQDPASFAASLGIGKALLVLNYPGDAWDRFERTQTLAETDLQKAELIYWRGQSLERLGELDAAMRDYQTLIKLPVESIKKEWVDFARQRISANTALTPTPTPKRPTLTITKTNTRQPSRTPTPTPTKKP